MSNTTTFLVSNVSDLSFERISDNISHKWADWEVRFFSEGVEYAGFLGACPYHPDLMHDETIYDAEPY